jgi:hypothetical protein
VEYEQGVFNSPATLGVHIAASCAAPQTSAVPFQFQPVLSSTVVEHQVDFVSVCVSSFRVNEFATLFVLQAIALPAEKKTPFTIPSRMKEQLNAIVGGLTSFRMDEETAFFMT